MVTGPSLSYPEPLRAAFDQWLVAALATGILWTRSLGADAIAGAQRRRLDDLVRHSHAHSPFYRQVWGPLPQGSVPLAELPVVTKGALMAAFDDWCTDRAVTWHAVERFIAARAHIGQFFLDRYLVWTSSGTTGRPGVFVQDASALAAYDALVSVQMLGSSFARSDWRGATLQGGRAALVTADCDHFASIVSWRRVAHGKPWLDLKSFAVTMPLPELVAGLNAYRPAFVASYPTVLALLADEQRAGRLHLQPAALWAGGEFMSPRTQAAIEAAFGAPVHNEYGASECLSIAYGCREGWLHANADWVILEPVDEQHRPSPPGELSHTVLLTNLANTLQPIVRYDLGDRVRMRAGPGPCACGSALPAFQVEGRCDDVVALRTPGGVRVRLPPLVLATVVEEAAHVHWFQIVQASADRLLLRLAAGERRRAGPAALAALRRYLDRQGLAHVGVGLDAQAPQPDARDGKLRQVLALHER